MTRKRKRHFIDEKNTASTRHVHQTYTACGQPVPSGSKLDANLYTKDASLVTCSTCQKVMASKEYKQRPIIHGLHRLRSEFARGTRWKDVTLLNDTLSYIRDLERKLGIPSLEEAEQAKLEAKGVIPDTWDVSVWHRIKSILTTQLGVKPTDITPEASWVEDLGADSLDTVELVMAIEEEFELEIPDEDAERMENPRHVYEYLAKVRPALFKKEAALA